MTSSEGMVKLFFEEIPAVDEDGDEAFKVLEGEVERESSRRVGLKNGGVLEELEFSTQQFEESKEEARNYQIGLECWTATSASGPKPRGGASMCQIGHHLYVFGGASRDGTHFDDLWRTPDPSHVSQPSVVEVHWEELTDVVSGSKPHARSGHTATAYQIDSEHGWMLVFGGLNAVEEKVFNDTYVLFQDGLELRWQFLNCLGTPPQPRTEHGAVLVGTNLIVFGGSSPYVGPLRDLHILDVGSLLQNKHHDACTWSTVRCLGPSPSPREMHSMCVLPGETLSKPPQLPKAYGEQQFPVDETNNKSISESDKEASKTLREEGNACFVKGEFQKACELYTASVNKNPECFLSFGNRSACKLKLSKAREALHDAIRAVRINPTWSKGYYREAQACVALGLENEAHNAFQSAIECASSTQERSCMEKQQAEFIRDRRQAEQSLGSAAREQDKQDKGDQEKGLQLYVFGGRGAESVLSDMCVLDLETMTWSDAVHTCYPRCGHSASAIAPDKMLVFGGWNGGMEVFASGQMFNAKTNMWTDCFLKSNKTSKEEVRVEQRFSHASCIVERGDISCFGGVSFEKDHGDLVLLRPTGQEDVI